MDKVATDGVTLRVALLLGRAGTHSLRTGIELEAADGPSAAVHPLVRTPNQPCLKQPASTNPASTNPATTNPVQTSPANLPPTDPTGTSPANNDR